MSDALGSGMLVAAVIVLLPGWCGRRRALLRLAAALGEVGSRARRSRRRGGARGMELIVNLAVARRLGVRIPAAGLERADLVIR